MNKTLLSLLLATGLSVQPGLGQRAKWNTPGAGNPIIPGYFADPTVKKIGDTYYIYATTDGNGGGLGPSQVWTSKDFVNWTLMPMNWPTTHWIWAPDVMQWNDGKYYMYYCQPCQIYCGVSETPRGPWKNILGEDEAVLVPDRYVTNAITLDGQTFVDDDGKAYLYFGTWGIYPGFGCGVAELAPDLKSFVRKRLIVNTEATDFFEAPFIVKKNGIYYFMYSSGSCHDHTYRVQYAISKEGPMGPYTYGKNNPILETTADKTIHGPGHHSVLQEGDNYYIVYHRHDIPGSTRGMHRQLAVDKLVFGPDGTIEKVDAGHDGIGYLQENTNPFENLAFTKKITASSYYNENFKPEYAVDDNNATLWRPRTTGTEWIQVDLGEVKPIRRVWTQFEYATSYYQYYIEVSEDGKAWTMFSDKRNNLQSGSPMVEYGDAKGRYVRLTVTGNEKNGLRGAIWNLKVFSDFLQDPPQQLMCLPASAYDGKIWQNRLGMLGNGMKLQSGQASIKTLRGREAVSLAPNSKLVMESIPTHFYSGRPYTLSYKVFSVVSEALNTHFVWLPSQKISVSAKQTRDMPMWHSVAIVSDGKALTYYLDGEKVKTETLPKIKPTASPSLTLLSGEKEVAIADVRLYNWKQEPAEIAYDAETEIKPVAPATQKRIGLLVDITADDYMVGGSVSELKNKAALGGLFDTKSVSLPVELKANRKAFVFNGRQNFQSTFGLPAHMTGCAPYSIEAWVMNPEVEDTEYLVDLVSANGELEKITFGIGKNAQTGVAAHNGSYEDMGAPEVTEHPTTWKHLVVTYDGYMERIFLNGKQIREKDIVLRLPESRQITIGQKNNGESPFSGYLHSLRIYDVALDPDQIASAAAEKSASPILFQLSAPNVDNTRWMNEGSWFGVSTTAPKAMAYAGKLAISQPLSVDSMATEKDGVKAVSVLFALPNKVKKNVPVLEWEGFSLALTKKGLLCNGQEWNFSGKTAWQPGTWYQLVLNQKGAEWAISLNGKEVGTLPYTPSVSGANLSVNSLSTIKKPLLAVASLVLYKTMLSQAEVASIQHNAEKNELQGKIFQLGTIPLSPQWVRLAVQADGKDVSNGTYSFRFSQPANGFSTGWISSSYALMPVSEGISNPKFYFEVKDEYGNIFTPSSTAEVKLDPAQFDLLKGTFDVAGDWLNGAIGEGWTGLLADKDEKFQMEVSAADGQLTIASQNAFFNPDGKDNGPVLYKEVEGDFLMQVKVTDFTGRARRRPVGYDEGGLMILDQRENGNQNALHFGVFPHYGVGNILTNIRRGHRMQQQNNTAWEYRPYLQIERVGDLFYVRCSMDGQNWEEMVGSPVERPDLSGRKLKVGLYQVTYGINKASFSFDDFQLWQRK